MKLVVIERDGVLNVERADFVKSPDEWQPISGSMEAIAALNYAGFPVIIATNQSGLARGLFTVNDLNAIHRKMHDELERIGAHIDAIFFCPHGPKDLCSCRKPKSGMLEQIAERFYTEATEMTVIGASLRDLQAAQAIGAQPVLVATGNTKIPDNQLSAIQGLITFNNLSDAVNGLLEE